jgi:hypothetical protein
LKNARNKSLSIFLTLLATAWLLNVGVGCSDETTNDTGTNTGVSAISVDAIILNPKSPGLGDTLRVTAVVTSASLNSGEFVSYDWSATGGTFVENGKTTVRWVAPMTSTALTITVNASNSVSSASKSVAVFVGEITTFLADRGGEMKLSVTGDSLISLFSPTAPDRPNFLGWGIRVSDGSTNRNIILPSVEASNIRIAKNFKYAAYNTLTPTVFGVLASMNYVDMESPGQTVQIPNYAFLSRPMQYTEADFSPAQNLLAYQVWYPDRDLPPSQGGVDTFQVCVWDIASQTEKRVVTGWYDGGGTPLVEPTSSFHPTFSTTGNWLTYINDGPPTFQWEYHAVPVSGASVDPDTVTAPTAVTTSGGLMGPDNRTKKWSPVADILATTDVNNNLWLVSPPTTATQVLLGASVREFAWAPSGNFVVVSTGGEMHKVDTAGSSSLIGAAEPGDRIARLAVSEDLLLYHVTRLNSDWYELIDLTGVAGLTEPVKVTAADVPGNSSAYASVFSLAPVWSPNEDKAFMMLFGDRRTPEIATMDFSGLTTP